MTILGSAKTGKYLLGNFELRVGPQSMAGQLSDEYSLGIVDNVNITSTQDSVDMQGMFPQEILDTAVVRQTTEVSATLREFSKRNMNLLTGKGFVKDSSATSGTATITARGSATTEKTPARLGVTGLGSDALKSSITATESRTPVIFSSSDDASTILSKLTNVDGTLAGSHPTLATQAPVGTSYVVAAHKNFDSVLLANFSTLGVHELFGRLAVGIDPVTGNRGKLATGTFGTAAATAANSTFSFPTGTKLIATWPTATSTTVTKSTGLPVFYTVSPGATAADPTVVTVSELKTGTGGSATYSNKATAINYTLRVFFYNSVGKCLGYLTPNKVTFASALNVTAFTGTATRFNSAAAGSSADYADLADAKFYVVGYADGTGVTKYTSFGTDSARRLDIDNSPSYKKYLGLTTTASVNSATATGITNASLRLIGPSQDLTGLSLRLTSNTPKVVEVLEVATHNLTTNTVTLTGKFTNSAFTLDGTVKYSSTLETNEYSGKLLAQQAITISSSDFSVTGITTGTTDAPVYITLIITDTAAKNKLSAFYASDNLLDNALLEFEWTSDGTETAEQKILVAYHSGNASEGIVLAVVQDDNTVLPTFTSATAFSSLKIELGGVHANASQFTSAILEDDESYNLVTGTDLVLYQQDAPSNYQIVTIQDPGTYNPSNKSRLVTFTAPVTLQVNPSKSVYRLQLVKPVAFGDQLTTQFFSARLVMLDRVDNVPVVFDFWKCTLSSGSSLPINTQDFASTELKFNVIAPSKRDEAIYPDAILPQIKASPVFRYAAAPDAV